MKKYFVGFSTVGVEKMHKTKFYDMELVKRDLLNEFMTKKGERVMNPSFGSIVWDMLFEPMTEANRNLIIEDTKKIVNKDIRTKFEDINIYEGEIGIGLAIQLTYVPEDKIELLFVEFRKSTPT